VNKSTVPAPRACRRNSRAIEEAFLDELRNRRERLKEWLGLVLAEAERECAPLRPVRVARKRRRANSR
jgi:hypothetical protein